MANTLSIRNPNRLTSVVITKKDLAGLSLCMFDQAIDSNFKKYEFLITGLKVGTNLSVLRAQLSTDYGNTFLSFNYEQSYIAVFNGGASTVTTPSNFVTISGFDGINNTVASYGNNGSFTLHNPSAIGIRKNYDSRFVLYYPAGNFALVMGSGRNTTTFAINAVRFFPSAGLFTAGTITMIGYY